MGSGRHRSIPAIWIQYSYSHTQLAQYQLKTSKGRQNWWTARISIEPNNGWIKPNKECLQFYSLQNFIDIIMIKKKHKSELVFSKTYPSKKGIVESLFSFVSLSAMISGSLVQLINISSSILWKFLFKLRILLWNIDNSVSSILKCVLFIREGSSYEQLISQ